MNIADYFIGRGKLLVERHKLNEQTKSGIILPNQVRDSEMMGMVVKMGPNREDDLLPGLGLRSMITFSRYAREIEFQGNKYLYLDVNDVILYSKVTE